MPEHRFDGRVAVVTGSGRGIGRGYALLLGARGAKVVVNDKGGSPQGDGSDVEPARAVAKEIADAGGTAVADNSDVSTVEGGQAAVDAAIKAFGRIDILINNAGNMIWGGPPDVDADNIQRHIAVHIMGSFNTIKAAWPHMAEQDYGRIVLTTSTGLFGLRDNLAYAICKAGMIGMAHSLSVAAEGTNIKINVIAPNAMTRLGAAPDTSLAEMERPPVENMGTELVAPMVAYLAHEDCPVSAEVYVAGAGKFGRLFVGATEGYLNPVPSEVTIETVSENWAQINNETGYYVPTSLMNWAGQFLSHLGR
jgi:NAD(P)-dependent dehydrogenase (short-subunit alcohol dehydrogenase family)